MTDHPSPATPDDQDSPEEPDVPELNETEVDEAVMDESAENPALDEGRVITPVDDEDDDDPRQA